MPREIDLEAYDSEEDETLSFEQIDEMTDQELGAWVRRTTAHLRGH